MEIETKAKIIEEFLRDEDILEEFPEDEVVSFFEYNDMGIPLSQALIYGLATLTSLGESAVEETWFMLCAIFGIDPNGEYEDLNDCLFLEDDDDE